VAKNVNGMETDLWD